ncbi:MAG: HAD superfamily hydrolase (TIGR01509 family) [Oceanospirillaceae bacterium]|jgi:HAD superfamily hydrolase (TIGR01509 family)
MGIKAVLFDHDGTIVDSERAHFEMWRDVLSQYNVQLTYEQYTNHYVGIPTTANAKTFIDKYSLNVEVTELILEKTKITSEYLSQQAFPLMNGALESLRHFYEHGLKVGIVTGAGRDGVSTTIENYGLEEYISVIVSGDDVKSSKPAPDCYLLAARKLGLHPLECLAIEDTYNGSLSAIRADIKCIGVSSSQNVRDKFSNTVYECRNLNLATLWISQNLLV